MLYAYIIKYKNQCQTILLSIHEKFKYHNTVYLSRISKISGDVACSATRIGDAFPQESNGTSTNLNLM